MIRKLLFTLAVGVTSTVQAMPFRSQGDYRADLIRRFTELPDSMFRNVTQEHLLIDETYVKLARDGWNMNEISPVMSSFISKNIKELKGGIEFGRYAKQWLPQEGYAPGGDSMYQFIDTTYNETVLADVRRLLKRDVDPYREPLPYTPEDREAGRRTPGLFRPVLHKPSSGRIHWIHVHPENDDSLIVIADGAGMFRTHNAGRTWECITDRIPVREHRTKATHSAIPVDPDDWNHIYAFMDIGNPVYQTMDGGQTWRRIEGATHYNFKRGYAFRDARGNLKFIGARQNTGNSYYNGSLHISEDTCKTWTQVIIPEELKEVHTQNPAIKGAWFQQVEFDPTNRDMIYIPTSQGIYYFDDGATKNADGKYVLKRMKVRVYNEDKTELRSDSIIFPYEGTSQGFLNIDPNNPDRMWYQNSVRSPMTSALFFSEDKGETWITLKDGVAGIGSGHVGGNESPWGWLGGFGVNYRDPNWVYGCSMSSAISSDGGRNFLQYGWGSRMKSLHEDGNYYWVTNARHNADNHCIVSHKSGRVFRGSDAGVLMVDLDLNDNVWQNISGNMGQMLYYSINANEFGDQMIAGNTQDIDVQIYRQGRWGNWRGYEGSNSFTNPYSGAVYHSGGGGQGMEDTDYGSWVAGKSYAEVTSGLWYMFRSNAAAERRLMRVDDVGRSGKYIIMSNGAYVNHMALSRQDGKPRLFIHASDKSIRYSDDQAETFHTVVTNSQTARIAADPNNNDILYSGESTGVYTYNIKTGEKSGPIGTGLPEMQCNFLFFHEGSGDLYFANMSVGIYIKENGQDEWRLWMDGFNTTRFKEIVMNYTTQEMYICDYGRGVYVADLQNPADRYLSAGFKLKELSNVNGTRTIGIDLPYTIPHYYRYKWVVNGEEQDCTSQYLTKALEKSDRVSLTVELRESPDVQTTSSEYRVEKTDVQTPTFLGGNALHSDGSGMVHLGNVDHFRGDFTVGLWLHAQNDGVFLGNRQRDYNQEAKGWIMERSGGKLRLTYSPVNNFAQPSYEIAVDEQSSLDGGELSQDAWHYVTFTNDQDGSVKLYIDGVQVGEAPRIQQEHSLNNSMQLTAFADGFERAPLKGSIDELKIWNKALSQEEIRRVMHSHKDIEDADLLYYNDFNAPTFEDIKETYSKQTARIPKRAVTSIIESPVLLQALCHIEHEGQLRGVFQINAGDALSQPGAEAQEVLRYEAQAAISPVLYAYDATQVFNAGSNLDIDYYKVLPYAYEFANYSSSQATEIALTIPCKNLNTKVDYTLIVTDAAKPRMHWTTLGVMTQDESQNQLTISGLSWNELRGKVIMVIEPKPSIQLVSDKVDAYGIQEIYTAEDLELELQAKVVAQLKEPAKDYYIDAEIPNVKQLEPFQFVYGKAKAKFAIDPSALQGFNQLSTIKMVGQDDRMAPLFLRLRNRIVDKEVGSSLYFRDGTIVIGAGTDFAEMNNKTDLTMMTWVRIDTTLVLEGDKPLALFRTGSNVTGIHLKDGNLRCYWNNENWSYSTPSELTITTEDLGRWMHVAVVARTTGVDYYLNGVKSSIEQQLTNSRITTALCLGSNTIRDKYFKGAFDEVKFYSRALTSEEVHHAMYHTPSLSEEGLVMYNNMDHRVEAGTLADVIKNVHQYAYSGTTFIEDYRSVHNFNPIQVQQDSDEAKLMTVAYPGEEVKGYQVTKFWGMPYNYILPSRSGLSPLGKSYLTYHPKEALSLEEGAVVEFKLFDPMLKAGESVILAVRPMGSEMPFTTYVDSKEVIEGQASFEIEASLASQALELMLFATEDVNRVYKAKLHLVDKSESNRIVLKGQVYELEVEASFESGIPANAVTLQVVEKGYVTIVSDTIKLDDKGKSRHTLRFTAEQMNLLAWNPVTLQLSGAQSEPLELEVSVEPRVRLHLLNGTDENEFLATDRVAHLDIEAELIQGIFEEDVEFEVRTDHGYAFSTKLQSLLSNSHSKAEGLEFTSSEYGTEREGWNTIANPYSMPINLTKHQNYNYDDQLMSPYVYRYDASTGNYLASDINEYDQEAIIAPLQPFFVKTVAEGASFEVTPIAKETTHNRKTFDYFASSGQKVIRLELLQGGQMKDYVNFAFQAGASEGYVALEDAPKMWAQEDSTNQIYTLSDDLALSYNILPTGSNVLPIGFKIGKEDNLAVRLKLCSGFEEKDVVLVDKRTNQEYALSLTQSTDLNIPQVGRFDDYYIIRVNQEATGVEDAYHYPVIVDGNICTITGLRGNADVCIYDVAGRICYHEMQSNESVQVTLENAGVYLIKIEENNESFTTKIIIR